MVDVNSSRFLVLLLNPPNLPPTVHITIYLPTSGLDAEFVEELSSLENVLDDILETHPKATVFIRGDANSSLAMRAGNRRDTMFKYFCERLKLISTDILHPTYHQTVLFPAHAHTLCAGNLLKAAW